MNAYGVKRGRWLLYSFTSTRPSDRRSMSLIALRIACSSPAG